MLLVTSAAIIASFHVKLGILSASRPAPEKYPLRVPLVNNAGFDQGSIAVNKVIELEGNLGYNVATGEYVDMIEAGIIDPVKVTRSALQNAASISGLLLTTDCMIAVTEVDPPTPQPQQ